MSPEDLKTALAVALATTLHQTPKIIPKEEQNIDELVAEVITPNGGIRILPATNYKKYSRTQLMVFMHKASLYTIPTKELIDYLQLAIGDELAIEIACGMGIIGRELGIPRTDSMYQARPEVQMYYRMLGQPNIQYPQDIEKLSALEAVEKYQPSVVIASFAVNKPLSDDQPGNLDGVDEMAVLKGTKRYIHIGNDSRGTGHIFKPILGLPHSTIFPEWLITRGEEGKSCIKTWTNAG